MTKAILITRSAGDGDELRHDLQQLGHRVLHEPLTDIFLRHDIRPQLQQAVMADPNAVIATSRYGVRSLAALSELRDIALICVGEATAKTAYSLGYTRVSAAEGDADALVSYILNAYDEGSRFLYVSGEHISADLPALLAPHGMQVTRLTLYEATASQQLSDTLVEQLRRGQIDGVTFLSRRTAEIFMLLLAKAEAVELVKNVEAYCISDSVADALDNSQWKVIHVAGEPTLASMVACVDNA